MPDEFPYIKCEHGRPRESCPFHDIGVLSGDEDITVSDNRTEREILLSIEAKLADIVDAVNSGNGSLNWLTQNTAEAFGFIKQIQANGGPAALLGAMMGGKGNG